MCTRQASRLFSPLCAVFRAVRNSFRLGVLNEGANFPFPLRMAAECQVSVFTMLRCLGRKMRAFFKLVPAGTDF